MKFFKKLLVIAGVMLFAGQSDLVAMYSCKDSSYRDLQAAFEAAQRDLADAQAEVGARSLALIVTEEAYDRACMIAFFNPNDHGAQYQVRTAEYVVNGALYALNQAVVALEGARKRLLLSRIPIALTKPLPMQFLNSSDSAQ